MSIDLEWEKLDAQLANHVVDMLNRQLRNADRPSFIGPIEVTSLDFGSSPPDVELVDMRDIYRDFLDDDEDEGDGEGEDDSDNGGGRDHGPVKVTERAGGRDDDPEDEEGFEWVSRRAVGRHEMLAYQHLPPHVRYGRGGPTDLFASMPSLRDLHHSASASSASYSSSAAAAVDDHRLNFAEYKPPPSAAPAAAAAIPPPPPSPWNNAPMYHRNPAPSTPFFTTGFLNQPHGRHDYAGDQQQRQRPVQKPTSEEGDDGEDSLSDPPRSDLHHPTTTSSTNLHPHPPPPPPPPPPPLNPHPNLQLHLHINWHSNLRITLTTSLLINYPSPKFMSLPIKLSITGLVFNGELAVAYEGGDEEGRQEGGGDSGSNSSRPLLEQHQRRIHVCILDDLDPYGPACDRRPSNRDAPSSSSSLPEGGGGGGGGTGSSPPELDDESPLTTTTAITPPLLPPLPPRPSTNNNNKPLPIGHRLLPTIEIESEIGQADKHVLKNVTRVERFVQDVIRKTVEEELVFPNFHTLLLMGNDGQGPS